MKQKTEKSASRSKRFGLPGNIPAADEIFENAQEMGRALDSFIGFLYRNYVKEIQGGSDPSLFGFIVTRMQIRRDPTVEDIEIYSQVAKGICVVLVPVIPNETPEAWDARRDQTLKTYWPSMQDAQIRAVLQLYRALSPKGRRELEKQYEAFLQSEAAIRGATGNVRTP